MSTKLCIRCKTAPAVMRKRGPDSFCVDCRRAYNREWASRPENRERRNASARERYHSTYRERAREQHRAYRIAIRREAVDAYGGVCACCGEHRIEFLAIHHINGNGKQHRMQSSGVGDQFFRWLKRQGWPQDPPLGVLCHNCNMAHGFYGYCPHDQERASGDSPDLCEI